MCGSCELCLLRSLLELGSGAAQLPAETPEDCLTTIHMRMEVQIREHLELGQGPLGLSLLSWGEHHWVGEKPAPLVALGGSLLQRELMVTGLQGRRDWGSVRNDSYSFRTRSAFGAESLWPSGLFWMWGPSWQPPGLCCSHGRDLSLPGTSRVLCSLVQCIFTQPHSVNSTFL